MTSWTASERARCEAAREGETVVASARKGADEALIAWATATGKGAYIGRATNAWAASKWANPYKLKDGRDDRLRDAVCDAYGHHVANRPELLAAIPELRGKVLICWCHPRRCHGDFLARLANEAGAK